MAIINHRIVLTENDWIEYKDIHRIQTPEEHLEMYCECCKERDGEYEVTLHIFYIEREDTLVLCKECVKLLSSSIINDEDFNSLEIQRL